MKKISAKNTFIFGTITIALIYSLFNIFLIDSDFYWTLSPKIRYINKTILILIIYGIGTFSLKNYMEKWLMFIWHAIHFLCFSILIAIGSYYWFFGTVGEQAKNISTTLTEILISPLFLICFYIINNRFKEEIY